jgi:hypothetical protein
MLGERWLDIVQYLPSYEKYSDNLPARFRREKEEAIAQNFPYAVAY